MARRRRNETTDIYPYRNRIPGCVCAVCGEVIEGTESHPGEVKAWQRIAGRRTNWHLQCAINIGKVPNRAAYEELLAKNPDLPRIELPPAPEPRVPNPDELIGRGPHPLPHPAVADGNGFAPVGPNPADVGIDVPEVGPDEGNEIDEPEPAPAVNGNGNGAPPVLPPWMEGFAQAILPYIEGRINGKLDKAAVLDLIEKHAVKRQVIEIHDHRNGERRVIDGRHHPLFTRLLEQIEMEMNSMLVGPCASGKSTEAVNAVRAMGYDLYVQSPVSGVHELLGYEDGPGKYHSTPFEAWFTSKKPAVLVWEEFDSNEANALLPVNAPLENKICNFPYSKTPIEIGNRKSVVIALGNTWGDGATSQFVGRLPQDAAVLNRYAPLFWNYDTESERLWAGNDQWVDRVQKVRAKVFAKGLQVVISPRASIRGAKKLAKGWPQDLVEVTELKQSMSDLDWRSVQ